MDNKIGTITHFFGNISVGIIELEAPLKVGATVKFQGSTTDFEQTISEMQVDRKDIEEASSGQEVGIKVNDKVREGDEVFLVS